MGGFRTVWGHLWSLRRCTRSLGRCGRRGTRRPKENRARRLLGEGAFRAMGVVSSVIVSPGDDGMVTEAVMYKKCLVGP